MTTICRFGNACSRVVAALLSLSAAAFPFAAMAEGDIDIFTGSSSGAKSNPNVLFVIDNTANWSNTLDSTKVQQADAELQAIRGIVNLLDDTINVGLMMMTDNQGSGRAGGYIRFAIRTMNTTNKAAFVAVIDDTITRFHSNTLKSPASANYGGLFVDAYKYFGGFTSPVHFTDDTGGTPYGDNSKPAGTITFTHADGTTNTVTNTPGDATHFGPNVYTTLSDWTLADTGLSLGDGGGYVISSSKTPPVYRSPITEANNCAKNYIIFVGNGFPNRDDQGSNSNFTVLGGVGGSTIKSTVSYSGDDWTNFLFTTDVSPAKGSQNVTTFAIDVFNAAKAGQTTTQNQTALLQSMAKVGGGKYYAANGAQQIVDDIKKAIDEILAKDSAFASAALPSNVTNRSINRNQVFIGMFRPDPGAQQRWFGNTKEYKIIQVGNDLELGDVNNENAVSPTTGFVTDCAVSRYTTDSGSYWQDATYNPRPIGRCPTTANNPYSDSPDGPTVEKGGIAEVIRRGNTAATNVVADWVLRRTLYTEKNGSLAAVNPGNTGLSQTLLEFVSGKDSNDENQNNNTTETRASLHGDVIHSRPVAIEYGTAGTYVFYGANDGTLRAAQVTQDSGSGTEAWAYIASEFFATRQHTEISPASTVSPFQRMKDNDPLVLYPEMTSPPPTAVYRDYFFDGGIGVYEADGSPPPTVWIYPTTRRGGRMIYALDVTSPTSPLFKWKAGCPNLTDDSNCTSNLVAGIGQTWSLPKVARIAGYSSTARVVIVGGGYDRCEDANSLTPACGSTKGNHVYVFDADSGALLKTLDTRRSVAADVALLDIDGDKMIDHVYVVDTGGSIYRLDFVDPANKAPRASSAWTITEVAQTTGAGRKFLFAPALWSVQGKVYVALGSGDREHPLQSQYPFTSPVTNRFYVYIDDSTATPGTPVNLDGSSLCNFTTLPNNTAGCDTDLFPNTTNKKGWFIDLTGNGTGEQTVTSAVITGGLIAFSTNRPTPKAVGTCATSLGEARGYWLNLFNACGAVRPSEQCGLRSDTFIGGGLAASPVTASVPINGPNDVPTDIVIGAIQRGGGASTPISPQIAPLNASSKRKVIYWNMSNDK